MRVIGRNSAGVRLFNVADNEHVVSAALIEESEDAEADEAVEGADTAAPDTPETDTPPTE
jgi:DNA gyrase subunit A